MKNIMTRLIAVFAIIAIAVPLAGTPAFAANANANAHANAKATAALSLNGTLKFGARGDEVKLLQASLASDPTIFSSTNVTGYFGPLTAAAVKKFQQKASLKADGVVGPITRGKLNEVLASTPVTIEDETDTSNPCVSIPPGHLIAPGWLKKNPSITIPEGSTSCFKIPAGILKKLGTVPTPTPGSDTTDPTISDVKVTNITSTSAKISWKTDELTRADVAYGTTDAYGTIVHTSGALTKDGSISLIGLTADTTYHFHVTALDASNNDVTSSDMTFKTAKMDTNAPKISGVTDASVNQTNATIYWITDEPSTTVVDYGTTDAYGSITSDTALVTGHYRVLMGLTAGTTYHYRVTSVDAAGNSSHSDDKTFTTSTAPDTTAPSISSIGVSAIGSNTATVGWSTNEAATGKLYLSTTTPVNKATAAVSTTVSGTTHSVPLTGLTADTQYYFLIEATDAAANSSTATEGTFHTTL